MLTTDRVECNGLDSLPWGVGHRRPTKLQKSSSGELLGRLSSRVAFENIRPISNHINILHRAAGDYEKEKIRSHYIYSLIHSLFYPLSLFRQPSRLRTHPDFHILYLKMQFTLSAIALFVGAV